MTVSLMARQDAAAGERRTTAALAGRSVVIRLFFRSSTLFGLMID
jgi:hypothetical protein